MDADAGIATKIGNQAFRATGITACLKNRGSLEIARQIAAHESSRTTSLFGNVAVTGSASLEIA